MVFCHFLTSGNVTLRDNCPQPEWSHDFCEIFYFRSADSAEGFFPVWQCRRRWPTGGGNIWARLVLARNVRGKLFTPRLAKCPPAGLQPIAPKTPGASTQRRGCGPGAGGCWSRAGRCGDAVPGPGSVGVPGPGVPSRGCRPGARRFSANRLRAAHSPPRSPHVQK